nr:unnamed protein product [Sorex araneus]
MKIPRTQPPPETGGSLVQSVDLVGGKSHWGAVSCETSGRENIIEFTLNSLLNEVSKRDLHLLLSRDKEWEQFVADAELTSDEAKAVHEGLEKHGVFTAMEEKEMYQQEKEFRENFLKLYPQVKMDVEENIKQLHALAKKADEVHKNCTIANVVAGYTSFVSGILCIASIGLAPLTGGLSLAVPGTGLVMGSTATVTIVVSTIVKRSYMSSIEAEAKNLESTGDNLDLLRGVSGDIRERIPSLINSFKIVRNISSFVGTIKSGNCVPKSTLRLPTTQLAFKGTSFKWIFGGPFTALAILLDVDRLVKNSMDLMMNGKSQSGEKLRARAQKLEDKLTNRSLRHEPCHLLSTFNGFPRLSAPNHKDSKLPEVAVMICKPLKR